MHTAPPVALTPASIAVSRHLQSLRDALELHEPGSASHAAGVSRLSFWLARELGCDLPYAAALERAAVWHDVGKLAIPTSCLHKPGALDEAEWRVMRLHSQLGAALLAPRLFPGLELAAQVAFEHHERYDGSGYPLAQAGLRISLAARIVAVADVFDALASVRCYKPAWPLERIEAHFRAERGHGFDPEVAGVLLAALERADRLRRGSDAPAQRELSLCA